MDTKLRQIVPGWVSGRIRRWPAAQLKGSGKKA